MSFQPVVPFSGFAGWRFLSRTMPQQSKAFSESADVQRLTTHFRDSIGHVRTVDDLMNDRRLLEVALGAFGLEEDLPNRAFIRKVLTEGTLDPKSFANKLGDKRYAALSKAFGFGDFPIPNTVMSDFADRIVPRFLSHSFQVAIGRQDNDLRLALNMKSDLAEVLANAQTHDAQWFGVMGNPALRKVFDTALGFSSGFAAIDIDKQLNQIKDRADRVFGTHDLSAFSDAGLQEKLIRLFLIRSEAPMNSLSSTGGSTALTLLQNSQL